jgi:hypothetical protein
MHAALPDASRIYLELGRVKRGLGREWNWPSFLAQYKRVDKSGDLLDALLAKELIWVVSRSPELASEFATLVAPERLAKAAQRAMAWAQAAKPDRMPMLDDMMVSATSAMAESSPGFEMDAYEDALAPLEHLVANRAELVRQCQRIAHAIDRPLSPEVMAKRISRVLSSTRPPESQGELLDALITMEVVFAAKKRPHKVADVLNAVPIEQRAHFEGVIASVLGTLPVDAGHDIAARALPRQTQMDMQAEFNVRQVLSDFQLSDFEHRRHAMAVLGKPYSWSDFQHDIQRQSGTDSGWQRAWWDEQIDSLTGTPLASFLKTMPQWYAKSTPPKTKSYPLGSYDPQPQKTWLSALNTHLAMQPTVVVSDANDLLVPPHANDYEVDHRGAVMAPAPILEVKTCNPWGGAAKQRGGRNLRGSETPYPNGW